MPAKILGDKEADLVLLFVEDKHKNSVFLLPDRVSFYADEPIIATGYPLGTDLSGKATVLRGNFIDFRKSKKTPVSYIQKLLTF